MARTFLSAPLVLKLYHLERAVFAVERAVLARAKGPSL